LHRYLAFGVKKSVGKDDDHLSRQILLGTPDRMGRSQRLLLNPERRCRSMLLAHHGEPVSDLLSEVGAQNIDDFSDGPVQGPGKSLHDPLDDHGPGNGKQGLGGGMGVGPYTGSPPCHRDDKFHAFSLFFPSCIAIVRKYNPSSAPLRTGRAKTALCESLYLVSEPAPAGLHNDPDTAQRVSLSLFPADVPAERV